MKAFQSIHSRSVMDLSAFLSSPFVALNVTRTDVYRFVTPRCLSEATGTYGWVDSQ